MNDMRAVIEPKSDQLNADSLLSGPITITITKVEIRPNTEQPVSIHFSGDNGRPYKCCKSMARVMVHCWGPDANQYVGRSMTLYCDPKVMWGGMAVGGIRISHMSDITGTLVMALTATKGNKRPFTVQPLVQQSKGAGGLRQWFEDLERDIAAALASEAPKAAVDAILSRDDVKRAEDKLTNGAKARLDKIIQDAVAAVAAPLTDDDDGFPGNRA